MAIRGLGLSLMMILTVSACESVPHGRLDVVNRTTGAVTISATDGSHRFVVPPCGAGHLDDFPLWHVRIASPTSPNGVVSGADVGRQVLLLSPAGAVALADLPDPLPPCVSPLP